MIFSHNILQSLNPVWYKKINKPPSVQQFCGEKHLVEETSEDDGHTGYSWQETYSDSGNCLKEKSISDWATHWTLRWMVYITRETMLGFTPLSQEQKYEASLGSHQPCSAGNWNTLPT